MTNLSLTKTIYRTQKWTLNGGSTYELQSSIVGQIHFDVSGATSPVTFTASLDMSAAHGFGANLVSIAIY